MQTRFKYPLLLAIVSVVLFSSCNKSNSEGKYIPANAAFVVHFDGESLNSKMPWEEIKKSELFKELYADTSAPRFAKDIMDNPENSGIDIKDDVMLVVVQDSVDGAYFAVEGTLKDAAKFKDFLNKSHKTALTETEKDGVHFLKGEMGTASWKDKKFIFLVTLPDFNPANRRKNMIYDTSGNYTPEPKKDLTIIAGKLFALKESNSLTKDDKFSELMSTKGDIHFWMNPEGFGIGNMMGPGMAMMSMMNFDKLLKDSRTTATVNFDNGKINVDFKSYSGKEMSDLMRKYSGDNIDKEMLKRIPSKDVAGLFALNFKPEGIREYLKLLGVEGFANMGTAFLGFNLDDFIKANKGDILLTVSDIRKDSFNSPKATFLFSASIGDKPSFNKLVAAGKKLGEEKLSMRESSSIFYNMSDRYFAIGNNKESVDKFTGTSADTKMDFFDKLTGSSSGAYVNFQYIMRSLPVNPSDSLDFAMMDASLKTWDNMIAYGTGSGSKSNSMHIEINMMDKNTNSLKQLSNYMQTVGLIQKKRQDRYKYETSVATDTTTTVMAPVEDVVKPHH